MVVKILKRKKFFFLNVRLGTIFINQENEDVLHIAYVIQSIVYQKKFLVFSDGSNHDYHFITKESAEEFEEQFTCLGEHTKKLLSFSVPIEKEVARIDKKRKGNHKNYIPETASYSYRKFHGKLIKSY